MTKTHSGPLTPPSWRRSPPSTMIWYKMYYNGQDPLSFRGVLFSFVSFLCVFLLFFYATIQKRIDFCCFKLTPIHGLWKSRPATPSLQHNLVHIKYLGHKEIQSSFFLFDFVLLSSSVACPEMDRFIDRSMIIIGRASRAFWWIELTWHDSRALICYS